MDDVPQQGNERFYAMLDNGEQTRARRFLHSGRRLEFIAAHALVRGLLSSRIDIPPRRWRFTGESGVRPEVDARFGLPRLRVSLSHTRNLVIAAVAEGCAVGIDAECLGRNRALDGLLNFFCAPVEKQQIVAIPKAYRMRTAMTLWTLKEAYGKATGQGLSYPLTSYGFTVSPPALVQGPAEDGKGWLFQTFSPTPDHVVALAVHHGVNPPPRVSMKSADLKCMGVKSGESSKCRPHDTKL
jgi:4'-phosphopantetheinyl transferase